MKQKKEKSAFLEYFGDTPRLRVFDFFIGNHFFDFNLTDIARESNISYNSLQSFFQEFIDKKIVVWTRKIGKSDMYKLNIEDIYVKNLMKLAWILTKRELGLEEIKLANLEKEEKVINF